MSCTFNEVNHCIEISYEKKLLASAMFTMEQHIWIETERVKLAIQMQIKREFVNKFIISPDDFMKLHGHEFVRVMKTFDAT